MAKRRLVPAREERLQNLLVNHSMIFMGMFEETLTALADRMADAPSGSKRSGTSASKRAKDELAPEMRALMSDVFSEIREEAVHLRYPRRGAGFSVRGGPLHMIDNQDFTGTSGRHESQAELAL